MVLYRALVINRLDSGYDVYGTRNGKNGWPVHHARVTLEKL